MRISEDVRRSGKVGTGHAAGCVLHVCSRGLLENDLHPAAVYLTGPFGNESVGWHQHALDVSGCSEGRLL